VILLFLDVSGGVSGKIVWDLSQLKKKILFFFKYEAKTPCSYWAHGFIQDGLTSHRFLSKYSPWTLDFYSMKYIFKK